MSPSPSPLADAFASLRLAAEAAARAGRARAPGGLQALLLALLIGLLAALERLAHAFAAPAPGHLATGAAPFRVELSAAAWHQTAALHRVRHGLAPTAGCPQADAVALRLMPDWWLPCTAGFGMRPLGARLPAGHSSAFARAPPARRLSERGAPPRSPWHALIVTIS